VFLAALLGGTANPPPCPPPITACCCRLTTLPLHLFLALTREVFEVVTEPVPPAGYFTRSSSVCTSCAGKYFCFAPRQTRPLPRGPRQGPLGPRWRGRGFSKAFQFLVAKALAPAPGAPARPLENQPGSRPEKRWCCVDGMQGQGTSHNCLNCFN
jgi:hypothetical protein